MKKSLPLFQALFSKNEAKFMKLVASGRFPLTETDPSGRMLLSNAVVAEMADAVAYLIEHQPNPTAGDAKGWTALHFASYGNSVELAKQLFAVFPKVDVKDNYGNTPLWRAVFEENFEMVAYLKKVGADPNIKNDSEISPLDFARTIDNEDLVKLLS